MELCFVYNAKSGLGNMLLDGLHKVIRPSTYPCELCAITYHAVGMRKQWKAFIRASSVSFQFYYTDNLPPELKMDVSFPAVLRYENSTVSCILDKSDFQRINDLEELRVILKERVPELNT
jgi:hypothetical protein